MLTVILAGGFAKRLRPLGTDKPKPLLRVGGMPVIDYALESIISSRRIRNQMSRIIVLTNSAFESQYKAWARERSLINIEIISDGSHSEEDKPGAIGALASIASKLNEDFVVIAGDCIYPSGIESLIDYFSMVKRPVVGVYHALDVDQVKYGASVELDENGYIAKFKEKPENPTGDLVGAVVYAFPARIRNALMKYPKLGLSCDEPGRFIEWLSTQEKVHGYPLSGTVWDLGTMRAYQEMDRMVSSD